MGVYGALENGPVLVTAAAGYGFHSVDTKRQIGFADAGTAKADYDAQSIGFSSEARYRFGLGALTIAPLASLDVAYVTTRGGRESGAGVLNLSVADEGYTAGVAGIGVALGYGWIAEGGASLRAEVRAAYEAGFGARPKPAVSFAGGSGRFDVVGADPSENRLAIGVGLAIDVAKDLALSGRYDGGFGSDSTRHRGQLAVNYRF